MEIKFRAWNKVQNKMFMVEGLDFTFDPPAILKLNHEMPGIKVVDYWLHDEDFILMQYTGLKDKNGKEIYEGDILKWYGDHIYIVKWNNELAYFDLPRDEDSEIVDMYLDILGNIYENEDLLKGGDTSE